MSKPANRHERRGADRPVAGQWKSCPSCAGGMLLFTERYRARTQPASWTMAMPAWVCDRCPNVTFVRAAQQPSELRQAARSARVAANRSLMKARFVKKRAARALKKSQSQKRRD